MKPRVNQLPLERILLGPPYLTEAEVAAVTRVIKSGQLSLGQETTKFEAEFARWVGVKYAAAVSSGTAALHLAVIASGIQPRDEVITTPLSFVSSTNCVLYEKAVPKFVDIDPETLNIDVSQIEAAITKKTKAILAVDIFGYPAEWEEIIKLAKKYNLKIIEDAAEALGAQYQGKKLGSFGHLTIFAFYPNKQMTTGEGGMVTTNSKKLYQLIKGLSNQGRGPDLNWLRHDYLGYNYRLTEMQAALGRTQLKQLDQFLSNRQQIASWYRERLSKIKAVSLLRPDDSQHQRSWFIYLIRLNPAYDRDRVINQLIASGVPAKAYLPAIHFQPYLKSWGYKAGSFPVCEAVSRSTLALPFYTGMKEKTVTKVCQILEKILK